MMANPGWKGNWSCNKVFKWKFNGTYRGVMPTTLISGFWAHLGGVGFKYLYIFSPLAGEMIQFDLRIFFSNGLVQPPIRILKNSPLFVLQKKGCG